MKAMTSHNSDQSAKTTTASHAGAAAASARAALRSHSTQANSKAAQPLGVTASSHTTNSHTEPPASQSAVADELDGAGLYIPDRQAMIAEAAYYRAERRGFDAGNDIDDWLEAEAEIDGQLVGDRGEDGARFP